MPRLRATPICSILRQRRAADHLVSWIAASLDNLEISEAARLLNHIPQSHVEDKEHLLGAMFRTMILDDPLDREALKHLQEAAQAMGIGPDWFAFRIEAELGVKMDHLTALADLRLPRRHSPEEAKLAYQRMMQAYDPERIAGMGKGEAFEKAAEARRAGIQKALKVVEASGAIPLPIWDDAAGVLRPTEGAQPLVQEGAEPTPKKERVVVRVDQDEPPPMMSKVAAEMAARGEREIQKVEEVEIDVEYDLSDFPTKKKNTLLVTIQVWGTLTAFVIGAAISLYFLDPGLVGTKRFFRGMQNHIEAAFVSAGLMDERLPPGLLQEDPGLRIAYLEGLYEDIDATPILQKAARNDADATVRKLAYDQIVSRWHDGIGDTNEHEEALATMMWADDEEIRRAAQELLREEATSLSAVAKLMSRDDPARRKEGLEVSHAVSVRLEATDEWVNALRYRANREDDPELKELVQKYLDAIPSEDGEFGGVPTRRRMGD